MNPSEVAAEWATAEAAADCKVEVAEWATAETTADCRVEAGSRWLISLKRGQKCGDHH